MSGREPEGLPGYSPWLARWFVFYVRRYFARSFRAVRTSGMTDATVEGPLIVYANHPSWWDPIHFLLLARHVFPGRRVYGPMEAEALRQYGLFRRLGVFGVERGSRRGAAGFLRTSEAILEAPGASLWLTSQGRFADPRERPIRLEAGLAHLACRAERVTIVPLAVEYPFWDQRFPEALSRFGEPIVVRARQGDSVAVWTARLEQRLERTMDRLAEDVAARDPGRFRTLQQGSAGVGGIYDGWRRVLAWAGGRSFDPAHGGEIR